LGWVVDISLGTEAVPRKLLKFKVEICIFCTRLLNHYYIHGVQKQNGNSTVRKKIIGKRNKFEAVPKNSER